MIAERRTYLAKVGCWQDMVALIKEEMEAGDQSVVSRIYTPSTFGQFDKVVHEIEFKDRPQREAFWADWIEKRATPEFWEKWDGVRRAGGGVEIWNLAE